ncbi:hypothetical protein QBC37DRAFT_404750 [Rhypophila decipiens]|uniref:Uncharacterized protein n=1 Tax=Rhypophila decipiens TaxID=261697 RepID=A0AAN7B193_9PEZI|nr:hypothetical protein QBC37DRAFT_404750 [Rhypophila decipiens]
MLGSAACTALKADGRCSSKTSWIRKAGQKIAHRFRHFRTSLSAKPAKTCGTGSCIPTAEAPTSPPTTSPPTTSTTTIAAAAAQSATFGQGKYLYEGGNLVFLESLDGWDSVENDQCAPPEVEDWFQLQVEFPEWDASEVEVEDVVELDTMSTASESESESAESAIAYDNSAWESWTPSDSETTDATSVTTASAAAAAANATTTTTSQPPDAEHEVDPEADPSCQWSADPRLKVLRGMRIPSKVGQEILGSGLQMTKDCFWDTAKKHWPRFLRESKIQEGSHLVKLGYEEMLSYCCKWLRDEQWEAACGDLHKRRMTCSLFFKIGKARNVMCHPEFETLSNAESLDAHLWNMRQAARLLGDDERAEAIQKLKDYMLGEVESIRARFKCLDGLISLPFADCRGEAVYCRDETVERDCSEDDDEDWDEETRELLHVHDEMLAGVIRPFLWGTGEDGEDGWGELGYMFRIGMYYSQRKDAGDDCKKLNEACCKETDW